MLALKYRPHNFSEVIGQKAVSSFLAAMVSRGNLPSLMIFDGVHGSGKTTSARIIGAAMNCDNSPVPCGTCFSCEDIFDGTSLAVLEIDAASNGKVADMEELRKDILYNSLGKGKLVILDEAHAISREGFKSMLKTFEEAPDGVYFILVTTEFRKIPETIVSRAMRYTFSRVSIEDIVSRLSFINEQEGLNVEKELILKIADSSNGSVRDAIMLLDKLHRVDICTLEKYIISTGDKDFGPELLEVMISGGPAAAVKAVTKELNSSGDAEIIPETLTNLFKEILLLQEGMQIQKQGSSLEKRVTLAKKVSKVQIMNAFRVLWDLKTKIQHSEAYYEAYLAVAMLSEVFYTVAEPEKAEYKSWTSTTPIKRMTLEELKQI